MPPRQRPTAPPKETFAQRVGGVAVERAQSAVPPGLPLALRSAQHVQVSRGRFEQMSAKRVVLIEWVISGEAAMGVGARRLSFVPGDVAIYLPSIPLRFWAVAPVSEMCWFTVDGPLAEQFALELDLQPGVYPSAAAPLTQIQAMMSALKDHTIQGARRASLLAIAALYELANQIRTPAVPSVVRQAQAMIQQEFADPDLSIELMAEKLAYHRGSLSRLFHRHTGVTVIDYLTQVRLQEAKALLQRTPDKIAEVARKCGFREATYFCRWVRKHAGATPRDLRSVSQK